MPRIGERHCTAAHPPATEVVFIIRGRTFNIPIFQAARHYLAQRNAALAVEVRVERPGQRRGAHKVVRHEDFFTSKTSQVNSGMISGKRPRLVRLARIQIEFS